jgi:parallel beta-helix repeat protein
MPALTPKGYTTHAPICIDGNAQFVPNATNGVKSGNGTQTNPYVIEGWDINASTDDGITINNTNVHFTIRSCSIHEGYAFLHDGIEFLYVNNGTIDNNNIINNGMGLNLLQSNNIKISNNTFNNIRGYGIFLICSNSSVSHNHFSNCSEAIAIGNTNISVMYNSIDSCLGGIHIYEYSNLNKILYNDIANNSVFGIHMWRANRNIISHNTISYNGIGIEICSGYPDRSRYNRIYQNKFLNNYNYKQARDDDGSNFWNTTQNYGNYWSDWSSPDNNTDGIVDFKYYLDGGKGANDSFPIAWTPPPPPVPESPPPALALALMIILPLVVVARRRK